MGKAGGKRRRQGGRAAEVDHRAWPCAIANLSNPGKAEFQALQGERSVTRDPSTTRMQPTAFGGDDENQERTDDAGEPRATNSVQRIC